MIWNAVRQLAARLTLGLAVVGALMLAPAALAHSTGGCGKGSRHQTLPCIAHAARHGAHGATHKHAAGPKSSGHRTGHGHATGSTSGTSGNQPSAAGRAHGSLSAGSPAAVAPKCDDASKFTLVAGLLTCGDGSIPVCANGWDPTLAPGGLTITCTGATSADNGQATCDDASAPTVAGDGSIDCDDGSFATCPDGTSPTVGAGAGTLVCDAPGTDGSGAGSGGSTPGMCTDGSDPQIADDGSLTCDDGSTPQGGDSSGGDGADS